MQYTYTHSWGHAKGASSELPLPLVTRGGHTPKRPAT